MKKFQYDIKVIITAEQLNDLADQAIRGGAEIGWLDTADSDGKEISEGGKYTIHDAEEDMEHDFTAGTILKGLELSQKADIDKFDMYDADRVLQLGLFGKEVYA
jgi:hypothetical protein